MLPIKLIRGLIDTNYVLHPKPPNVATEEHVTCYACEPPKTFLTPELFRKHVADEHQG